jgi:protein-S-isoprenylcysteine O-methyltransferase Ste14
MSGGAGGMDLRLPIGGLFVVLGVILGAFGIMTDGDTAMYERSGGLNINLVWGVVMLGFGIIFLGLAQRAARR